MTDQKKSNLIPWRYAAVLKGQWSKQRAMDFLNSVHNLLFTSSDHSQAIDDFSTSMSPYYSEFLDADVIKPASHCIPTLMLWLQYPETQFFLRADLYNSAVKTLLGEEPEGKGNLLTSSYYSSALRFAETVRDELEVLGLACIDMIDLQGFLWGIFSRNRIWFGGFNYSGHENKLSEFMAKKVYATKWAPRLEVAKCFEGLGSLSKEQRETKRAALEAMLQLPGERVALLALFELATRPRSLLLAKSVWYDQKSQRSMMKISAVAITGENYSFDEVLGHQVDADWINQFSETVTLPSNLFPKVNSTLSWLSMPEALEALEGESLSSQEQSFEPEESEPTEESASTEVPQNVLEPLEKVPYKIEQALDGLFMPRQQFERMLALWQNKKNLILQGPPGVGKSFVAERLAYSLMGFQDPSRLQMIQFHQSYSYEDFVQGYRPSAAGGFKLRDGVFVEFVKRAQSDLNSNFVFIIDEVNRGNLSKILGELMLLIENDKRKDKWGLKLAYSEQSMQLVPKNVYLLGLMNTADRSLSLVDYALRRRFAFFPLKPEFESEVFHDLLLQRGAQLELMERIKTRLSELNRLISDKARSGLGPGFQIGHSFFIPAEEEQTLDDQWYRTVVEYEVIPLLEEYWFDSDELLKQWSGKLLAEG